MSDEKKAEKAQAPRPAAPAPPARRPDPPGVLTMHGVRPWRDASKPPVRTSGAPPDKMIAIGGPGKVRILNPAVAAKAEGTPKD